VIDAKMGATPDRNYDRIVAWLRRWEPGFVPSAAPAPAPSGKVAAADPDGRVTVRGRVCAGDEADIEDAAATCETPIAGATLVLRNGEREEVSATSGPDGRFALPPIRLTHGWNRFLVSAGGYSGLSSADLPGDPLFGGPGGGEEEITIRLPASTGHSP
jgi:hypothetical protein